MEWQSNKYDQWNAANKEEIKTHINKHHSIYLYGDYGTGKTHFIKWLAKKYWSMGHIVYVAMFSDISKLIKKEITDRKNGIFNKSAETKMKECKVLCIDDLGNEYMTSFTHELLVTIIDYRYVNKKATFITSNYSPEELYNIYEKAIGEVKTGQLISRLMTFGPIRLKAKNFREEGEYK